MALRLRNVERTVRNYLAREWSKLDFEFKTDDKSFKATADLTLRNHDDDISVIYTVYSGEMVSFRAVFDKIDMTQTALRLVNEFNDDQTFFCVFIREDAYLEVRSTMPVYEEESVGDYLGECLSRFSKLADNAILQQLTRLTH